MKNHFPTLQLGLLISLLLVGCSHSVLNSLTTISPGKQFELGGNQKGAFKAQLENVGPVPVTISERFPDGKSINRGLFQPGDRKTVQFAAESAVLVDNPSPQSAQLRLVITGDKNLSMREQSK